MSVEDVVQYESCSLKQYTRGCQSEIIRKAGAVIKVNSAGCSQECGKKKLNEQKRNNGVSGHLFAL